jgi:hypothetical protein
LRSKTELLLELRTWQEQQAQAPLQTAAEPRLSVLAGSATACLGVEEPTNTAVWPTVTRTVSLLPQHYGDLTFGITHIFQCINCEGEASTSVFFSMYVVEKST